MKVQDLKERIVCRTKKSPACYDGRLSESVYGKNGSMDEDGTFDPETKTICCDPCYIMIGQPAVEIGRFPRDVEDEFRRNIGA